MKFLDTHLIHIDPRLQIGNPKVTCNNYWLSKNIWNTCRGCLIRHVVNPERFLKSLDPRGSLPYHNDWGGTKKGKDHRKWDYSLICNPLISLAAGRGFDLWPSGLIPEWHKTSYFLRGTPFERRAITNWIYLHNNRTQLKLDINIDVAQHSTLVVLVLAITRRPSRYGSSRRGRAIGNSPIACEALVQSLLWMDRLSACRFSGRQNARPLGGTTGRWVGWSASIPPQGRRYGTDAYLSPVVASRSWPTWHQFLSVLWPRTLTINHSKDFPARARLPLKILPRPAAVSGCSDSFKRNIQNWTMTTVVEEGMIIDFLWRLFYWKLSRIQLLDWKRINYIFDAF